MMSQKRFEQLLSSHTEQATKVYGAVPIEEVWPAFRILGELKRNGINVAQVAGGGCLAALTRSGLIKESREGYRRVPVKPEKLTLADLKEIIPPQEKEVPVMAQKTPLTTTDLLADLSQRMAAMAKQHQEDMSALANDLANVALEVEEAGEASRKELEDIQQLKKLLKGFA